MNSPVLDRIVGIDYLPAVTHPPGVGRYLRELVRALVLLEERPELRLLEVGGGSRVMEGPPLGIAGAARVRRLRSRLPRRALDLLSRMGLGADRLLGGVDLFHRVFPERPASTRAPVSLAVAELPPPGSAQDDAWAVACRDAAATLVFCEDYRRRITNRYDLDPTRVHALRVGCEHWARDLTKPPETSEKPRLLVLGAVRRPRHPRRVLAAFEALRAGGHDALLCFVGRPGDEDQAFRAALHSSPARAEVTWIESPLEADMPQVVAGSDVLVHLAEEEGSPVTPLEAFSLGLGVVASRLPAFEEALGDEALYVNLTETETSPTILADSLATAITARTDDEAAAQRRALARTFTWKENARRTSSIWQDVPANRDSRTH